MEQYDEHHSFVRGLSIKTARSYYPLISDDDAVQIGWEGFLQAKRSWNGVGNLHGFASIRIRGAIIDEVRRLIGRGNRYNKEVFLDDFDDDEIGELLSYRDPNLGVDPAKTLTEMITPVTDSRDNFILLMYYEYDVVFEQIASMLGVTVSRISQLHSRGIKKLRKEHGVIEGLL